MYGITTNNVKGMFYAAMAAVMPGWVQKISLRVPSDQEIETYANVGMPPALAEWIGQRSGKGLRNDPISIRNKRYQTSVHLDAMDLMFDRTGQIQMRIGDLAKRAARHWEYLLSTLISAGTAGTLGLCADGQYYFDSDHSSGDSGTQLNLLTASQVTALNVGTAAAPTEAEMASAILGVIAYMMAYKDDAGEPMNDDAKNFVVMCPPNLWGPALAATTKTLLAGAAVANNPLAGSGFTVEAVMNPRFASATAVFYVFRADQRALIMQDAVGPTPTILLQDSEYYKTQGAGLAGVEVVRNAGFGLWQHGAHCTLS